MNQALYESCLEACQQCSVACDRCAASCLGEADVGRMARCIALDIDCAQLCQMAAGFIARDSELAGAVGQACMLACDNCADECARHPMQHCQDCARACRRCADECRRMSAARPAAPRHGGAGAGATH